MLTHAAMPMPLRLDGSTYRVYFATRGPDQRARIGWVVVDLDRPGDVIDLSSEPALDVGVDDAFDRDGVYPGSPVHVDGAMRLYYSGRTNLDPPRYAMSIGLAESTDGGESFRRRDDAVVAATSEDAMIVSTPWVLPNVAGWRMWFLCGRRWEGSRSFYDLRAATSPDGLAWERRPGVAVGLGPGESNLAAPSVVRDEGGYRMWFAVDAGRGYSIGYAESTDGETWERRDEVGGLAPDDDGWDAGAVAYPAAFRHGGALYLLYSGGRFGSSGIGLAVAA